jgi:hypothetical protein
MVTVDLIWMHFLQIVNNSPELAYLNRISVWSCQTTGICQQKVHARWSLRQLYFDISVALFDTRYSLGDPQ